MHLIRFAAHVSNAQRSDVVQVPTCVRDEKIVRIVVNDGIWQPVKEVEGGGGQCDQQQYVEGDQWAGEVWQIIGFDGHLTVASSISAG